MVYRLVPTYRFVPKSHFGMEDLKNVGLWEGIGYGLLLAALVLSILFYLFKIDKLKRYKMMDDNGNTKLDMKKFGLELILPISLSCVLIGGVLGHLYLKE
jgi:hypothetical protein